MASLTVKEQLSELFGDTSEPYMAPRVTNAPYVVYDDIDRMMQLGMRQGEALWHRFEMMANPLEEDLAYYAEGQLVELEFISIDSPPKVESEADPTEDGL